MPRSSVIHCGSRRNRRKPRIAASRSSPVVNHGAPRTDFFADALSSGDGWYDYWKREDRGEHCLIGVGIATPRSLYIEAKDNFVYWRRIPSYIISIIENAPLIDSPMWRDFPSALESTGLAVWRLYDYK